MDLVIQSLPREIFIIFDMRYSTGVRCIMNTMIHCTMYHEYPDILYTSLDLPAIPLDRSDISVHGILRPDQVQILYIYIS